MGPRYDDILDCVRYAHHIYVEETDGYNLKSLCLFPLDQFKFKDPCKYCLVRASCTRLCEDKDKHLLWHRYKRGFKKSFKDKLKNFVGRILWYIVTSIYYISMVILMLCVTALFVVFLLNFGLLISQVLL